MILEIPGPVSRWKLEIEPLNTDLGTIRRFGEYDDIVPLLLWAAQYHLETGPIFRASLWEWDGPANQPRSKARIYSPMSQADGDAGDAGDEEVQHRAGRGE